MERYVEIFFSEKEGGMGIGLSVSELAPALEAWLDEKLQDGRSYKEMHEELEALTLRHLLSRFDNKPTVLARATKMNRVTLRRRCETLRKILASNGTRT